MHPAPLALIGLRRTASGALLFVAVSRVAPNPLVAPATRSPCRRERWYLSGDSVWGNWSTRHRQRSVRFGGATVVPGDLYRLLIQVLGYRASPLGQSYLPLCRVPRSAA